MDTMPTLDAICGDCGQEGLHIVEKYRCPGGATCRDAGEETHAYHVNLRHIRCAKRGK